MPVASRVSDVELMQGGELPRRLLVSPAPAQEQGPAVWGEPLAGRGMLDNGQAFNLGRSVTFGLAAAANAAAQNILNIVGDDSQARVLTISLMPELLSNGAGDQVSFARAEVTWGSGGVQYTASIDFLVGAVFQLACSSLRIDVKAGGQGTFKANAHVGYGAAGEKSATRTVRSTEAIAQQNTATSAIQIPNFAKDFQYYRRPATANCSLFMGRTALLAPLVEIVIGNGPGVGQEVYRIPDGARFVWVVNGGAAAITDQHYIFGLCL